MGRFSEISKVANTRSLKFAVVATVSSLPRVHRFIDYKRKRVRLFQYSRRYADGIN